MNSVKYLLFHLNNPNSYKAVCWGTLNKIYNDDFESSLQAKAFDKQIEKIKLIQNQLHDVRFNKELASKMPDTLSRDSVYEKAGVYMQQHDKLIENLIKSKESARLSFKPQFDHHLLIHTFRARNGYNALMLTSYTFILDKSLNVVEMNIGDI